ncbi:hypothetical protein ASF92_18085 [Pedobacter sp. Leaf176]|nr:hypothetical protein ASF92_18085 [Pedobacter sp. Leaf176]
MIVGLTFSNLSFSQIRFHHIVDEQKIQRKYGFTLQKIVTTPPSLSTPYETRITTNVSLCNIKRKGVITVSSGQINFDIWQIIDDINCGANGLDSTTSLKSTQIRFTDNRATLGRQTKVMWVPFQAINLGLNTLPFRYRLPITLPNGTKTTGIGTTSFQLALNAGYTWGWSAINTRLINNYSITLGGYFGPSTADLKSGVYKDPTKYVADQTNATLTYGANLILARNNLGLVFAFGTENATGKNGEQWIYNGKPYLAFGINTSFGK